MNAFKTNLERVFADEANAHFDSERKKKQSRRRQRRLIATLSVAILIAVGATFYVCGVVLLNAMPY